MLKPRRAHRLRASDRARLSLLDIFFYHLIAMRNFAPSGMRIGFAAPPRAHTATRIGRRLLSSASRPLRPFLVERYPGWTAPRVLSLSSSECEPLQMRELLELADDDARERWESLSLGYVEHNQGSQFLRDEIACQYDRVGPDQVNIVAPQEGIYLAMRALLSPGDHVVVTSPCYQSLFEVALHIGCEVSHWEPRGFGDGGPWFDPADLEALLRPGTRLVVANLPHNPTGALPSEAEAAAIVGACERAGAHFFVDEMYRGLEHDGRAPLAAACDASPRGVTLGGVSKAHGLPGLRIGWLASQDAGFNATVARLKDYTTICPAAPSEVLATIALRSQPTIVGANRVRLARGRDALRAVVARQAEHLEWDEPGGGSGGAGGGPFAFVRLADGGSAAGYCDDLLERTGLMLLPSTLFGFGDERVRVTFGHDAKLERLALWEADLQRFGTSRPLWHDQKQNTDQ